MRSIAFLDPTFYLSTEALSHRFIAGAVSRRGDRDLGATHCVPLCAPEAMVVGRFFRITRPSMPRYLRPW